MDQVRVEIIRRMLNVLVILVNTLVNGEIDEHRLRNLEGTLYEMCRHDLLQLFRQTIQGNADYLLRFLAGGGLSIKCCKYSPFSIKRRSDSRVRIHKLIPNTLYTRVKTHNLFRVDENGFEQCCAAHIVQRCRQYC